MQLICWVGGFGRVVYGVWCVGLLVFVFMVCLLIAFTPVLPLLETKNTTYPIRGKLYFLIFT